MSEDAAVILTFEACLYIAWYIFDIVKNHDDSNPFAGWW